MLACNRITGVTCNETICLEEGGDGGKRKILFGSCFRRKIMEK